jgi:hypothetical protein
MGTLSGSGGFVVLCLLVPFAGCSGGGGKSGAGGAVGTAGTTGAGGAVGAAGTTGAGGTAGTTGAGGTAGTGVSGAGGTVTGGAAGAAAGTTGTTGAGGTTGVGGAVGTTCAGGAGGTASNVGYDIDVPSATVAGTFSINGTPFTSTTDSGGVYLRTAADSVILGDISAGSYSVRVVPGTYDVVYTWGGVGDPIAPHNNLAKLRSVTISGTGTTTLDVDVPSVVLTGAITIGGASVTSATDAGYLYLKNAAGDNVNLTQTSVGTYSARVVPGTYDIYYQGTKPGATAPHNQSAKLKSFVVAATGTTTMDIDVPSVVMSGMLTMNGAANTSTSDAGTITLRTSSGDFVSLGSTANGSYSVRVVPGSYDIYFNETAAGAQAPQNGNAKLRSIVIPGTGSTAMDIDVPSVAISGTVKVNGAITSMTDYGAIYLLTAEDSVGLGVTYAGSYAARVIPGSYDVVYEARTPGATAPGNRSAKLQSITVAATGTTTLNVDVPSVVVSGTLKINGTTVTSTSDAGNLSLETATGDSVSLGSTSAGSYSVHAIPGTYDLTYRGYSSSPTAPRNKQAKLRSVVVASGPTALDIDVPSSAVTGAIRINGTTLTSMTDYGNLTVQNGADSAPLGVSYTGTYSSHVIPGTYDLIYGYGSVTPGPVAPRNGRADLRCFTVQ